LQAVSYWRLVTLGHTVPRATFHPDHCHLELLTTDILSGCKPDAWLWQQVFLDAKGDFSMMFQSKQKYQLWQITRSG
jgi:hypothetical protein